ncbi:rab-GTPase-TBC domain-containing protein [Cunninghamella echinulata]|nr:rab-GTPase-TBC domain-containing protein [Cunninghamella echinulata]
MPSLSRSSTARYEKSKKSERIRTRAISFNTFLRHQSTSSKDTPLPPPPRKQPSSSFLAVYETNNNGGGASSVDTLSEDEDINDIKYNDNNNNNNNNNTINNNNKNTNINITNDNNHNHDIDNKDQQKMHKVQKKRSKLHLHIQPSLKSLNSRYKMDDDDDDNNNNHMETPVPASAPLEKKLSTTFKEKLSLARRSQSTKSTMMLSTRSSHSSFHLWRSSHSVNNNNTNVNNHSTPINSSTLFPSSTQPKLYDDGKGLYPPPQKSDPNHRDQYGFIRSTQWITIEDYDTFEQIYTPIMHRRTQKWRSLLEENNGEWPQRSSKFKRYVRKGIPPEFRRLAWLHYSGGGEKMRNNVGVYQKCIDKAMSLGIENEHLDIIERDLHRTFPDNDKFKSKNPNKTTSPRPFEEDVPAIQSLRRLLYAFSVYSPTIGYCQSLNYIAGLLLLFMEEEEAFWTFVVLIHDILPPNVYDVTMEGASIDQTILMMLLSERCPHIWQRVSSGRNFWECEDPDNAGMPTSSLVTSHWFLTLFINILPTESVLRVWDCLFYEGRKALMRIALAIFKINEHEILSVSDPLEVFQVVQNMPKRMHGEAKL